MKLIMLEQLQSILKQIIQIYIDSQDLINVIPSLANIYDEPFGDSSQIPTYLISKFAKQDVTVALSGDGGDELFVDITDKITDQYWKKLQKIPLPIRKLISFGILKVNPSNIEKFYSFLIATNHIKFKR